MAEPLPAVLRELVGRAAPPRRNGELAFEAPWESRLFGLTMTLLRAGRFEWTEFQRGLIREIAAWDARPESGSYWGCWERAFEALLEEKGLCRTGELAGRAAALATRPPGHDHG